MLAVEGEYGIIKPARHGGRVERVHLSKIRPWKSKNTGRMQRDGVLLREDKETMEYVIFDKTDKLVWAGAKMGFIPTTDYAIKYEDPHKANMGIGGLKRSTRFSRITDEERAEVIPLPEAQKILANGTHEVSSEVKPAVEAKPIHQAPKPKEKVKEEKATPIRTNEAPRKTGDREVDEALSEYSLAMKDIEDAHLLLMDARERADKAIARMTGLAAKRSQQAIMSLT